ncbi:MAG: 5-methyltetrahydropteroyltriglutamate--homocysteine S-methyltransferase [Nitrospirae bacterium]|nr:5-methyltetrahydropteroyltriglutamate--homocysteine S-methyltransferase [Candidatus Troglogloeales bacterium]
MAIASNLGFPRIGPKRELKKGVEGYWAGKIKEQELRSLGLSIRKENWLFQQKAGIVQIPSNDFSFYDHLLDTSIMVGAIPVRYRPLAHLSALDQYFAMARGYNDSAKGLAIVAAEMTKWFDTNYHYIVPEFEKDQQFSLGSTKAIDEFLEAKEMGILTTPVLPGPISFLALGKGVGFDKYNLLPSLLCVYAQVLSRLVQAGAQSIQFDEPALVFGIDKKMEAALLQAYTALSGVAKPVRISIATYFEGLGSGLESVLNLPVSCVHLDLVAASEQLEIALTKAPESLSLSLGVVDGRNIWRSDLSTAYQLVKRAVSVLGTDRVAVAPSCSLLHVPVSLDGETDLDPEVGGWLAFAREKVAEVALITRAINEGEDSVREEFAANKRIIDQKKISKKIYNQAVQKRTKEVAPAMLLRKSPHSVRKEVQAETYHLPTFPTTTIGSFPQTNAIREARAAYKSSDLSQSGYETVLRSEIEKVIRFQEEIGLDVLVHGEAERNDMVEYFGEQLSGFVFTKNGWVQSYGSRCVKPPIIFGDVARPTPMTVRWARFAQSLTKLPVKGMLTGPITILKWSFVRNDQPVRDTCLQIALAIRDEVRDLEADGIGIIQIDEPALREGLPLLRSRWPSYLSWAVDAFRLATSCVSDKTQIHTHMCYAEFNDIIESIGAMDADVISMESSRSQMELLNAFTKFKYPNEIGPGVYDIHSPRVPSKEEMVVALQQTLTVIDPKNLWVNPDCGLKTRKWEEVRPALLAMVEAAKIVRAAASKPGVS